MTCPKCEHHAIKKFGTYGTKKIQRFRWHQTLRVTPAMEAGLTDHIWSLRELLIAA